MFVMVSCDENSEMNTIINSDGSCSREIVVSVKENPERFENWDIVSQNKDSIVVKYFANYQSVEQMCNDWYTHENSDYKIVSSGNFDKSFKWFYTDYCFNETFKFSSNVFKIPYNKYFTDEELSFWNFGKPNIIQNLNGREACNMLSDLEKRISNWMNICYWNEMFDIIENNYSSIINPPLNSKEFSEKRDSLIQKLMNIDFYLGEIDEKLKKIDELFGSEAFVSLANNKGFVEQFNLKTEEYTAYFNRNYKCTLKMPGNIKNYNLGKIVDNSLIYNIDIETMTANQLELVVTSRKINVWAFVVSVLVLIVAIGSFFIKRK